MFFPTNIVIDRPGYSVFQFMIENSNEAVKPGISYTIKR